MSTVGLEVNLASLSPPEFKEKSEQTGKFGELEKSLGLRAMWPKRSGFT